LNPAEDPSAGAGAELGKVSAENAGQRRCDGYPPPFADRAGFQVPLFAPRAIIGPFCAHLGRCRAEPQFAPVIGRFFEVARGFVEHERRKGEVVDCQADGFLGP
jgi:hypothetical protein